MFAALKPKKLHILSLDVYHIRFCFSLHTLCFENIAMIWFFQISQIDIYLGIFLLHKVDWCRDGKVEEKTAQLLHKYFAKMVKSVGWIYMLPFCLKLPKTRLNVSFAFASKEMHKKSNLQFTDNHERENVLNKQNTMLFWTSML